MATSKGLEINFKMKDGQNIYAYYEGESMSWK